MRFKEGKRYVKVYMDQADLIEAFIESERRETDAVVQKRGNKGGAQRRSAPQRTGYNIYGVAAEMAVAHYLDLEWTGKGGSARPGDIHGGIEVKYTGSGHLLIQPDNEDGWYVVVSGGTLRANGEREFVIRGCKHIIKSQMQHYYGPFSYHGEGYSIPYSDLDSIIGGTFVNPDESTG